MQQQREICFVERCRKSNCMGFVTVLVQNIVLLSFQIVLSAWCESVVVVCKNLISTYKRIEYTLCRVIGVFVIVEVNQVIKLIRFIVGQTLRFCRGGLWKHNQTVRYGLQNRVNVIRDNFPSKRWFYVPTKNKLTRHYCHTYC